MNRKELLKVVALGEDSHRQFYHTESDSGLLRRQRVDALPWAWFRDQEGTGAVAAD